MNDVLVVDAAAAVVVIAVVIVVAVVISRFCWCALIRLGKGRRQRLRRPGRPSDKKCTTWPTEVF